MLGYRLTNTKSIGESIMITTNTTEGYGRNVRWTHWVTNEGLECNDTLCTMHRRELSDRYRGVTSKPQLEDENFGCNECEGDKAYD